MDTRIREFIDLTKTKFGLEDYYLQNYALNRHVDIFNDTVYTLSMEWFPSYITEQENEDDNPEGTAAIDLDVNSGQFKSVIFVGGKSYAKGSTFHTLDKRVIIKWIEQETGLTYGKHFQLLKEKEKELRFQECIHGVPVFPSGSIDIEFDQEGKLTFFAVHGQFPPTDRIKEETYSLSLKKVEDLAKEQVKLIEFPSIKHRQLVLVYGIEEMYVSNDQTITIPFEQIQPEQAFSSEPHPNTFSLTTLEQEECITAVEVFLRQVYPNESGKWILRTLHRDKGYILATLRQVKEDKRAFQRKLLVFLCAKSRQAVNYMDNKPLLDTFKDYEEPEPITINKDEAYRKIRDLIELKPIYVYDFERKHYILCGKIDCQYGIHATSGEVIALDNL